MKVPESWKNCEDEGLDMVHATEGREDVVDFVNNIQAKVSAQEGNTPTSIRIQGVCRRYTHHPVLQHTRNVVSQ